MNKEEIIKLIQQELMEALAEEDEEVDMIDENENFMHLGISSVQALTIINSLKKKLDLEISPVALFEYKTISDFAEYLANGAEDADEE